MRIDWMMCCRYVETNDCGTTIVGAGAAGQVMRNGLPGKVLAHVAFALVASYYELQDVRAPFEVRVFGPDMSEVAEPEKATLKLEGAVDPSRFPEGAEGRRIIAWDVEWEANEFGSHLIQLRLGDSAPITETVYVLPPQ